MITISAPPSKEEISEAYGRRLKRLRGERSQSEVAGLVGASQPMIAKAERGDASEELLVKLERLYGVAVDYPSAPRHPLRRVEWGAARAALIQRRGSRDAAVSKRGGR